MAVQTAQSLEEQI